MEVEDDVTCRDTLLAGGPSLVAVGRYTTAGTTAAGAVQLGVLLLGVPVAGAVVVDASVAVAERDCARKGSLRSK